MKRRPERLIRLGNSLGRREIEPESFVSSSCVGDRCLETCCSCRGAKAQLVNLHEYAERLPLIATLTGTL